jgi:WD40 repeat protein
MGSVWCCTFSPDGRYVASGGTGGLIKIWVAKTGLEKCTLVGHRGAVLCLEWSQYTADDLTCYGRIISGGEDKTLKVCAVSLLPRSLALLM